MMTTRASAAMVRLALLFFLTGTPSVALAAARYPAQRGAVVLGGALLLGVPLGFGFAIALIKRLEEEFAARYRSVELRFLAAAVLSGLGLLLTTTSPASLGPLGGILSVLGLAAAFRLLLRLSRADEPLLFPEGGAPQPPRQGDLGDRR